METLFTIWVIWLVIEVLLDLFAPLIDKIPSCIWVFHTTNRQLERHGMVYNRETETIQAHDHLICDHCYKSIEKLNRPKRR
jgi:hypothetical protein